MLLVFPQHLTWVSLLALPAFALLMVNGMWMSLLFGIVSTRFRDVPPIIGSVMQLVFYVTPIVWQFQVLSNNPHIGEKARIVELNPFLHYVEVLRGPLLGQPFDRTHWAVVIGCTVVGWLVTLAFFRNYRARISYWV